MSYKQTTIVLIAPILLTVAPSLSAQTAPPLLENDQVKVHKAVDKAHVKAAPHGHELNRVMVYMTDGRQEFTENGKKSILEYKAGDVKWAPAVASHTPEVLSDKDVTIIELEVKKPGDPSKKPSATLDALKVDPKNYHLEFENSQVRVIRVKMDPHEKIPMHEHLLNRAVVYLTDQHGSTTSPEGKTDEAQHKAGEVSWGTAVKHREQNLSDKPLETIVVEFKN
jgi:quercetin dioxygenase-like cupin family protein